MRTIASLLVVSFLLASTAGLAADRPIADQTVLSLLIDLGAEPEEVGLVPLQSLPLRQVAQCCKVCRKGKACGNSCIKKTYTCSKPPGCACNTN